MAHVDKRGEHRYRVRYRDPLGKERSKTFTRGRDARRFKSVVEDELARGTWVDPQAGKNPLCKFAADVLGGTVNVRPSTSDRIDAYLRNQVLPGFGELALNRIDRVSVQAWVNQMTQVLAPRTVRDAYRILSRLLGEAERQNLIRRSPCHRITLPLVRSTEPRYLAPDQVERLAGAIDPRFRALIVCGAFLGLRWSELAGLKRINVDLAARRVRVVGALHKVGSTWRYTTELKTARSRRSLALAPFIAELWAEHLADAPPSEFVFSSPKGGLLAYGNFRRRFWDPAVARSGPGGGSLPTRYGIRASP